MFEQTALGGNVAGEPTELPYVFAVAPNRLVGLDLVDNAHPRPIPVLERLERAAEERNRWN